MLSLSAISSSPIRSAVSRMASWEAKRGGWGQGGSEEEDEEEGWKQSSKSQGESVFLWVYFVLNTHSEMFLALEKRKGVFVSPFAKKEPGPC